MTKRRTIFDELDPFDSLDEVDGFEGYILTDEGDEAENVWYRGMDDHPFCDMGFGDDNGLCIKALYDCHIEGCETATQND